MTDVSAQSTWDGPGKRRHAPSDAMRLLLDPERHLEAADLARHPAYRHADARSRGWNGQRLVDYYRGTSHSDRAATLGEFVRCSPKEFAEKIPPLLVKTIHEPGKRVPWGPWGDPFFEEKGDEDLHGLLGAEKARTVVVPCPLRRMLDTLVAGVLIDTGDHLLHPAAWAYRPGRHDAVPGMIEDVRQAVRDGGRYWAKLDLKSFFPSMPWPLIRRALSTRPLSYPPEFVERVMALVEARLVNAAGETLPNQAGSQAGSQLSAIIANMVLWQLDTLVTHGFRSVGYWRYSDDIIIVGRERHQATGAVRFIRGWCHQQGLQLKGVAP